MSQSDIAVAVRGLGKSYTIAHNAEKHVTLAEAMVHRMRRPFARVGQETFWALQDLSFNIQKGEVVGIIGRNGAGKSTLLKILSRITEPTKGQVHLYGRIGSLLEVGTGFHPELTGRENIFLNGQILGMRKKEIERQFDAIVDFSGVEKFLDTPVKRYSSGMYVRLAFAVAAHLQPEILIVDEVLAVGDAEFQKKCMGKMQDIATNEGRTVLFVSHNMNAVSTLCKSAILLKQGKLMMKAGTEAVIEKYSTHMEIAGRVDLVNHVNRRPEQKGSLRAVEFLNAAGETCCTFAPGDRVAIRLTVAVDHTVREPRIGIGFNNARGERIFAVGTFLSPRPVTDMWAGESAVVCEFTLPPLVPGPYTMDIGLAEPGADFADAVYQAAAIEVVESNYLQTTFSYFHEMGNLMVRSAWRAEAGVSAVG